ncbi:hypothetical protein LCGC14_0959020 [marine sediment metagenome]|uniref:Transcription regulator PadR N-terminal domain-containing protein n=1 Tax=marine sediment metagenome TaxID=412755 RepID=A0A0F9P146_9ZZZZ|nr:PadR family transcriptional regulator [archaeon]
MSEKQNDDLSHVAFVVLGLVAEHPNHGKDINKRIEDRGMRNWTDIGKSSIYGVLKTLKRKELVESWVEEEDNRIVKIYQITTKGNAALEKRIYKILSEYNGRNNPDFYVAFSMLPGLTQDARIEALTNSLIKIKENKKELEKKLKEITHMPVNVTGLFIHPIKILQVNIEFLTWVLEEIKDGGNLSDSEKNGD